ncbi:hypothetical protein J6590_022608 [Homalodisca vitripennis]|nr:hypothetical protein J6590_022608 [Homalodisca vitripennis]
MQAAAEIDSSDLGGNARRGGDIRSGTAARCPLCHRNRTINKLRKNNRPNEQNTRPCRADVGQSGTAAIQSPTYNRISRHVTECVR